MGVRVLHKLNVKNVVATYISYGCSSADILLPAFANDSVKTITAQYTATETIVERAKFGAEIRKMIADAVQDDIIIADFYITRLGFSDEYTAKMEAKMAAEHGGK